VKLTIEITLASAILGAALAVATLYVATETYRFLSGPHG